MPRRAQGFAKIASANGSERETLICGQRRRQWLMGFSMKSILQTSRLLVFVSTLLVLETGNMVAAPLGTAFNYQGRLQQSGTPANGFYVFHFGFWDDAGGGTLVGTTQAVTGISV